MNSPRILIIAQDWEYMNPTRQLLHHALQRDHGALLAGVGYSLHPNDPTLLDGNIDLVIAEPWAFNKNVAHPPYDQHRPNDIRQFGAPVAMDLMGQDMHVFKDDFFDTHLSQADYLVNPCTSPQFQIHDHSDALKTEKWLDPNSAIVRDPSRIDDSFVFMPHALASTEFAFRPMVRRSHDISVLGADYAFRRNARRFLGGENGFSSLLRMDRLQTLLGRAGNHPIGRRYGATGAYRRRFERALEKSKISATCDAQIGYAIRKFFEIPARGALLAGHFFRDKEALGFVDQETCIALNGRPLSYLAELARAAHQNAPEIERVAKAGQEMVRTFHTVEKRAQQMLAFAEVASQGRPLASYWKDGEFHVAAAD